MQSVHEPKYSGIRFSDSAGDSLEVDCFYDNEEVIFSTVFGPTKNCVFTKEELGLLIDELHAIHDRMK